MTTRRTRDKTVSGSIAADLIAAARAQKIDLSSGLAAGLESKVGAHRREEWLRQNAAAIEAYNHGIEQHGTFGDELRSF